jgi:hypothetical protein
MPRISDLTELTVPPADTDKVVLVDVNDPTMAVSGTTKWQTFANFVSAIKNAADNALSLAQNALQKSEVASGNIVPRTGNIDFSGAIVGSALVVQPNGVDLALSNTGTGDYDIQSNTTGTSLTPNEGFWHKLANATSCQVNLDSSLANERSTYIEAVAVPSGAYTLVPGAGFTINGAAGSLTLCPFIGAQVQITRDNTDFKVIGDFIGDRDFGRCVVKNARGYYDEFSGNQNLTESIAPAGATLANIGAAPTWTLPSRIASAAGAHDSVAVAVHNFHATDSITFTASGPTLVGVTTLAAGKTGTIEWVRKGTGTERVVVRAGA